MITETQQQALLQMYSAAKAAEHIWPAIAACEAMEESGWGTTKCFLEARNPFGEKQTHPQYYPTLNLPTWEVIRGQKQSTMGAFIWFPNYIEAFKFRMDTLKRLPEYYADAIAAATQEDFITQVCGFWDKANPPQYHGRWSTDPNKAKTVLQIYNAHKDLFG